MKLIRYTATVKESGDSYSSFSKDKVISWCGNYAYAVAVQDDPWEPNFEITEEVCLEE
jgi:hypothetical protein